MWYNPYINIYLSGKTKKQLAQFDNDLCFQNVFTRLMQTALNRYEIKGLPDTCSERVILQSLLFNGSVVFFEKDGALLALPGYPDGGGYNIYGDFLSAWVYSWNGAYNEHVNIYVHGGMDSKTLLKSNGTVTPGKNLGVYVRENAFMYPFINQVLYYSKAIADTLRSIDVCRSNLKSPYLITAQEEVVNSVKRYFEERDTNVSYIINSGVFPSDKVNLLPINTSADAVKSLSELCDWYSQRFYELAGIDSLSQIDKKGENLIQAEVSVNDEIQAINIDASMKYIQQGLDDVNFIFGTNLTVQKKGVMQDENILGNDGDDTESVSRDGEGDGQGNNS